MRVAVWRMGARFLTSDDSTVGGGRIAEAVLKAIRAAGHEPTVVSAVQEASGMWLDAHKFKHTTEWRASDYDAVVVLTGPSNPMYAALYTTYGRLAAFEGPVIYAWYDAALGFEFDPQRKWSKFREKSSVKREDLFRNKTWTILGQSPMGAEGVGFEKCVWELIEATAGEAMPPAATARPRFGYFGSPRPPRIKELNKWFGENGLPLDLHGKGWKPNTLKGDVSYVGAVKERMVRKTLNMYAATLYAADPVYIRTDFVAQRFIENAMAGVPVAYSSKLQPTIKTVVPSRLVFSDVKDMREWFAQVTSSDAHRQHEAISHREIVMSWVNTHPAKPDLVIKRVLP